MRNYFIFFIFLFVSTVLFSKENVSVAIDPDYAPFTYKSFEGKPEGLFVEFWRLWAKKSGYDVTFKFYDWDAGVEAVRKGDVIFHSGLNPEASWMVPSKIVYKLKTSFYKLKNRQLPIHLRIGSIDPYYAQLAKENFPAATVIKYYNYMPLIKDTMAKKIDIFIDDNVAVDYFLLQKGVKTKFETTAKSFQTNVNVVTNKKNKKYITIFNKYFNKISIDELQAIETDILGKDIGYYNSLKKQKKVEIEKDIFTLFSPAELMFFVSILFVLCYIVYRYYTKTSLLNIRFKVFNILIVSFELLIIFFILYEMLVLDRVENSLAKANSNQFKMIQLINKLRQSSDDLTNLVRAYAATGDTKFKQQYYDVLKIRNGEKARPVRYEAIYWDLSKKLRQERHPDGKKQSFDTLLKSFPFSKQEVQKLKESKNNSNTLVSLEVQAFKQRDLGNKAEALKILYSPEYYQAKQMIMLPIDDVMSMLSKRTNKKIMFLNKEIKKYFIYLFVVSLFFILVNFLIYLLLHKKINQPIEYLTDVVQRFHNGEKDIVEQKFYHDEIGMLNQAFFEMMQTIEFAEKELKEEKLYIESVHKHTRESIEYASLIQGALIPDNNVFRKYFQDYFAIWHPKDMVGGDIYLFDELRHDDECLLMVIDCTGHGVPGAFVTMLIKAIERQIVAKILHSDEVVSPANLLGVFNRSMKNLLKQESIDSISNAGFDGAILYYNKKEKVIKFAGANLPLFYVKNGELNIIKGDRYSVGYKKCDANHVYKEHTISIEENMQIYLTTDGYIDQNGGEKGFPFGKKRFQKLIEEYASETMPDQQEAFLYEIDAYQGTQERNDDMTLIGLKI